jgi:hypothetical protein
VTDSDNRTTPAQIGQGMVFSRSFEYDNRKTDEFNENFSQSFDFDFQLKEKKELKKNFLSRYAKSTTFTSLTGVSPNYLTKKETSPSTSMTSIFPKVIHSGNINMRSYFISNNGSLDGMSNRQQVNNRLNSCDSGARSGNSDLILSTPFF